jgi:hypothetical protein
LCSALLPHEENGKFQEIGEETNFEKKTIAGKSTNLDNRQFPL